MDNEKKTTVDYDLIKQLVKYLAIGAVAGYVIPMVAGKIGVSEPLAFVVAAVGYIAWVYSSVKSEQKEATEAINTACEKSFMAGMEYALKEASAEEAAKEKAAG